MTFKTAAAGFAAIAVCMGLAVTAAAQTDELQEVQQLLKQGQTDRALERIDQYLKTRPKDARGRFLRGILLAEQNKPNDAIRVFNDLTRDYPELPEPYNNLAVLYASQGQYDKARGALEQAIRTHPSYATAHENLGDIYAKMASQAYDKALQLDKGNQAAQTKLNLIKDLFTTTAQTPTKVAVARVEPAPKPAAAAPASRPITPPPAATPSVAAAKPAAEPAKKPAPAKPAAPPENNAGDVLKAVNGWAADWANNDVDAYLARYAPGFKVPGDATRKTWEAERKARIAKPRKIEIRLEAAKVSFDGPGRATVSFRQHYRSDPFVSTASKTLVMIRSGDKWLIEQERVGG
jgi:hypothetical protein